MHTKRTTLLHLVGVLLLSSVLALHGVSDEWIDATNAGRTPATASLLISRLPRIAFVRRANYGMRGTNATMFGRRTGEGSAICILHPDGRVETVFETTTGFILDVSPSYDGKTLVMSYKPTVNDPFHVWEINADGSSLRQITDGPYHDFNPVYYPDGRIVFCSSRSESYSVCQNFLASSLHTCAADGSDLRRIDFTTLCTVSPAVMPDGSIICSRWEYQDKNIFSWQGLWTIHPDGRQLKLYYGNTLTVPNSLYGPEPVPGTGKVVFTMAAHHHVPIGDIAIVDRAKGIENPDAMRPMTRGTPYRVTKDPHWNDGGRRSWGPGDKLYPKAYVDPMPLDADHSLVSFAGESKQHGLYLLRHDGFIAPLHLSGEYSCYSAVPLSPRQTPQTIPGDCPQEPGEGYFFVQDVYQGLLEQGVERGEVKALRVIRVQPKKFNTEGPRYHDHYPLVGYGSYYVKDNLGTAPVDENGTAYFRAPSNCELYFIALDANGKEIQRMGTVTQITTGERVSCIGCHENRDEAPQTIPSAFARLKRSPDAIEPPSWGGGAFDYVKQVQPILDRYCVSCHSGRTPKRGIDLSGDKSRFFNMSYEALINGKIVDYYYINPGPTGVFAAKETGSWTSKLTQLIESKHNGVDMDDRSRRAIYAWIDSNVQYYSIYDMSRPYTVGGRDPWSVLNGKRQNMPAPWFSEFKGVFEKNCASCHKKALELRRGPLASPVPAWINLTHPENSRVINAHLSKDKGGMGLAMENQTGVVQAQSDEVTAAMLQAIEKGSAALYAKPRVDMDGAVSVPQERKFGRVF